MTALAICAEKLSIVSVELGSEFSATQSIDQLLHSIPRPELQSDMRARLQARIDQIESSQSTSSPQASRGRSRWSVPISAALAAGLAALWLTRPVGNAEDPVRQAQVVPPLAPELQPAPKVPAVPGIAVPQTTTSTQTSLASVTTPDTAIQDASDEELAIAFQFEVLNELDLIQELDLLEALLAMEETEAMERERQEEKG
jgi:hypothetical protein